MADNITDINEILRDWADIEIGVLSKELEKAGKAAVKELRTITPPKHRTGAYARSWKARKIEKRNGVIEVTVYNKDHYQLTHLLEYGHAKWIGGRDTGEDVDAFPHISIAEQHAIEQVESELKIKL